MLLPGPAIILAQKGKKIVNNWGEIRKKGVDNDDSQLCRH